MKQRLSQSFVWTVVFVFPLFCRRKAFDDFCLLHLPHLPPQSCRRSQKCLARSSSMLCHGWGTCPCFFPSRRQKMWLGWPRLVFDNWRGRVTAIWIKEVGFSFSPAQSRSRLDFVFIICILAAAHFQAWIRRTPFKLIVKTIRVLILLFRY